MKHSTFFSVQFTYNWLSQITTWIKIDRTIDWFNRLFDSEIGGGGCVNCRCVIPEIEEKEIDENTRRD